MGKHAYLIMSHDTFYNLKILLKMLDDNRNDIFVHIDKKCKHNIDELRMSVSKSKLVFLKPMSIYWGHSSIVKCELTLIEECLKYDNYQYVHLLSGTDLPLKSQDYIHSFFDINKNKQFLQIRPVYEHLNRLAEYHFFPPRSKNKAIYYFNRLNSRIEKKLKVNRLKRYKKIDIFKCSQWFSITGECAKYVLSKKRFIIKLTRFTLCPDEMFLATVLLNSKYKNEIYNASEDYPGNMRLVNWNGSESPSAFVSEDYQRMISSEMLFARKFDEKVDKGIIDMIYKYVKSMEAI